jgi:alpha-N-acetylglucosamine transferase
MDKFRILQLTQYRRVLLLDGDAMPLANLDYLFQLSDDNKFGPGNSTLESKCGGCSLHEWNRSANAGFFMLTPGEGEYERIQEVSYMPREQKGPGQGRCQV